MAATQLFYGLASFASFDGSLVMGKGGGIPGSLCFSSAGRLLSHLWHFQLPYVAFSAVL